MLERIAGSLHVKLFWSRIAFPVIFLGLAVNASSQGVLDPKVQEQLLGAAQQDAREIQRSQITQSLQGIKDISSAMEKMDECKSKQKAKDATSALEKIDELESKKEDACFLDRLKQVNQSMITGTSAVDKILVLFALQTPDQRKELKDVYQAFVQENVKIILGVNKIQDFWFNYGNDHPADQNSKADKPESVTDAEHEKTQWIIACSSYLGEFIKIGVLFRLVFEPDFLKPLADAAQQLVESEKQREALTPQLH